jgi:hypothetical protein
MFNSYLTFVLQLITIHLFFFFFDKTITRNLKAIMINCNENIIETNIHIQKMENIFFNAQQY